MALDALRSAFRRGDQAPTTWSGDALTPADPIVSGSTDAAVFACPGCGRTIPKGSRRCDGCGQRLLLDLPARKVTTLTAAGALAGFIVGGVLVGLTVPRAAAPAATASNGPIATAAAFGPVTPIAAAEGAAALRGTTTLNGRLVAEAGPLARAVAAKTFPVSDVVKVLRRMSADTRAAAAMVKALDGWPAAGTQQAALAAFYAELGSEIDGALAASSRSVAAYKTATRQVVATLAKVAELDAASRSLAADVGLSLPVIVLPEAAP